MSTATGSGSGIIAVAGVALGPFLAGFVAAGGDLVDDADLGLAEADFGVEEAARFTAAGSTVGHEMQ
ncbi:hypothetical protein [Micromonospora rhizosphaerae]|uniref:hypothetical protein n=1 Tax=Micromonospora rhizosphaerae TaxID=568872 RepID=UPI00159F007C|nr:hypothetical protein [Micromonospora rhizosphaerae]